jgi:group II intron reverse transcriptase/maturase
MQDAETYLNVVRDRGRRGMPLERVYRQLFNPALYLLAYGKIARNAGATTPGVTADTADGMAVEKIHRIIGQLRTETYRWTPVRRVHIPKKDGRTRSLGIPTWTDKLLQEVIRLILEAYYEPRFSDRSHGFRPGRGCHTALTEIYHTWRGTTWFIEGDIKGCFDNLDHEVLLAILRQRIHDGRFLRLIGNLLKAGYLEDWRYGRTLSGTPQGGVVSPILANVCLDRLDQYVERILIPEHTRGNRKGTNPAYKRLMSKRARIARTDPVANASLRKQMVKLPSTDPYDPHYRRLRYVRYADDFLLGYTGPRAEAEDIKRGIGTYLREELKLELSEAKTLVTHGRTQAARFLGYDLVVLHQVPHVPRNGAPARAASGAIGFKVPVDLVREKRKPYVKHGKAIHRAELLNDSDYSIVAQYESEFRGIAQYYRMASNLQRLHRLKWTMEQSLTKTLAHKQRTSVNRVYRRYRTTIQTERGPRPTLQVRVAREGRKPLVATWGETPLVRDTRARLNDAPVPVWNARTELVERLLADTCELCGSRADVQVHHVHALKDLDRPGHDKPDWVKKMAARRRKTLVVCHDCHVNIHAGRPTRPREERLPESRMP